MADKLPAIFFQCSLPPQQLPSFHYLSAGCHTLLGLDPKQVKKSVHRLLDQIHLCDRHSFLTSLQTAEQTQTPWQWTGRFESPHQSELWLELTAYPEP
ncbi:MAG: PAS domain-containing protein, partial [Kamptonema sp. SIO4C4]|nr:PAS domain-containing protein [Kamptonema sp. SIO4C4]